MREGPGAMSVQFPRPGPVLKAVLIALVACGVGGALLVNMTEWGKAVFLALTFVPSRLLHFELWRLATSGLLTSPSGPGSLSHLIFTLIGLYFLSPDLERRWGSRRFGSFLALSVIVGNLVVFAFDRTRLQAELFHPVACFGALSAITAIAVAWARENPELEVRFFFFLPIKGKYLFWITVGYCVLSLVYADQAAEGIMAPFGGILVGATMGGSPSLLRKTYLELKLRFLQRQASALQRPGARPGARRSRAAGPSLRVLPGGLEEELRKREPPNDKRYLN